MELFAKAAALGIVASILAVLLRQYGREQAALLNLAAAGGILLAFVMLLKPVLAVAEELEEAAGLDPALTAPVLRCVGLSIITRFASSLCRDAGSSAAAEGLEAAGTAAALFTASPLFLAVLKLVRQLVEG